eukprot:1389159-Amorphochlora_amoeboformis.AAC.1
MPEISQRSSGTGRYYRIVRTQNYVGDFWRSRRLLEIPEIAGNPGDCWKSRRLLSLVSFGTTRYCWLVPGSIGASHNGWDGEKTLRHVLSRF